MISMSKRPPICPATGLSKTTLTSVAIPELGIEAEMLPAGIRGAAEITGQSLRVACENSQSLKFNIIDMIGDSPPASDRRPAVQYYSSSSSSSTLWAQSEGPLAHWARFDR